MIGADTISGNAEFASTDIPCGFDGNAGIFDALDAQLGRKK
jgi:hypothetical protein